MCKSRHNLFFIRVFLYINKFSKTLKSKLKTSINEVSDCRPLDPIRIEILLIRERKKIKTQELKILKGINCDGHITRFTQSYALYLIVGFFCHK